MKACCCSEFFQSASCCRKWHSAPWICCPPPALAALHLIAVVGAYFLWYWHHGGQTLAMQTWKIRLESVRGGTPELWQLGLRYLLAWPSLLFFGVGIVWALLDRDRQFLHDRLAATRLVRVE